MKDKKEVFTTREVGNFCGVDLTTVINWIKQDKLKAYKTAGGHRRIKREDIIKFMEEYSMPIPSELKETDGKKIMVVDDDPNILNLISNTLKKLPENYKMATAADGFEAGQKLALFKPTHIILDIRLPGMDGYEIIKKIRENDNGEKIIAITAYGNKESKEKVLKFGANKYITKPFSSDELLEAIKSLG
ncbi:MAG: response regulator [Elusimicrobiota bacterium]